jgi:uncharacterized BrkB/YihY/UPF0761 family membrane protein
MNTPVNPAHRQPPPRVPTRHPAKRGLIAVLLSAVTMTVGLVAYAVFAIGSAIFLSASGNRHAELMKDADPVAQVIAVMVATGSVVAIVRAFTPVRRVLSWGWLATTIVLGAFATTIAPKIF